MKSRRGRETAGVERLDLYRELLGQSNKLRVSLGWKRLKEGRTGKNKIPHEIIDQRTRTADAREIYTVKSDEGE